MTNSAAAAVDEVAEIRVQVVDARTFVATGLASLLSAEYCVTTSVDDTPGAVNVTVLGEASASWRRSANALVVHLNVEEPISALRHRIRAAARSRTSATAGRRRAELTDRENAVLLAAGRGESTTQVASALGLSVRTVERHRHDAMRKLGVQSAAHAVARSIELGVLRDAG